VGVISASFVRRYDGEPQQAFESPLDGQNPGAKSHAVRIGSIRICRTAKLVAPLPLLMLPAVLQAQDFIYSIEGGEVTIAGYSGLNSVVVEARTDLTNLEKSPTKDSTLE